MIKEKVESLDKLVQAGKKELEKKVKLLTGRKDEVKDNVDNEDEGDGEEEENKVENDDKGENSSKGTSKDSNKTKKPGPKKGHKNNCDEKKPDNNNNEQIANIMAAMMQGMSVEQSPNSTNIINATPIFFMRKHNDHGDHNETSTNVSEH
ncbi:kinesin-related protein 12-like [Pectinophora gossypiella]|uniref:kinesin-related protein 12-like n=1 Tax=Pectinophora gossypiella TaxID=13191 RepID=UPI00214E3441|nr:kinesin-related protein 12-like [Pectinophora gossypiella]